MATRPLPLAFPGCEWREGNPVHPIQDLLDRRCELQSAFQPILCVHDRRLLGHEALLRLPAWSGYAGPLQAFDAAAGTDLLVDLDHAALETHLRAAATLPAGRLFVNLSAPAFLDQRLQPEALTARVRAAGLCPSRVVLEVTELVRIPDPVGFASALRPLSARGFQLAVDDFGAGFSSARLLVELGPDFVKIDRSLVAGASSHPRKRAFLESISTLGRRIGCAVIGEGAETPEDVVTLRACGIPYAQGWALARPAPPSSLPARAHLLRAFPGARMEGRPVLGDVVQGS